MVQESRYIGPRLRRMRRGGQNLLIGRVNCRCVGTDSSSAVTEVTAVLRRDA